MLNIYTPLGFALTLTSFLYHTCEGQGLAREGGKINIRIKDSPSIYTQVSDPGIPGVRSMGPDLRLSVIDLFET